MAMDVVVDIAWKRSGPGAGRQAVLVERRANRAADRYTENIRRIARRRVHVITGHLRDSITRVQTGPGASVVTVGAYYGVYENYGTRYRPPHPFWEPSIAEAKRIWDDDMRAVFRP